MATSAAFIYGCARAERGPLKWIFGNPVSIHLGIISYPFYLWHWPVIVFVEQAIGDRWSSAAWKPLAVLLSLAAAELTFWFVERPIHTGQVRLPRPSVVLGGAVAASVVALLLATTGVPGGAQVPTEGTGLMTSGAPKADSKVLVVGDSLAWVVGGGAPKDLQYKVNGVFQAHCDIIGQRIYLGSTVEEADPKCPTWPQRWAGAVKLLPDAVVMLTGLRQLFDLDVDGKRVVVGTPEWETEYRRSVERALTVLQSQGDVPLLIFNVPCYRWENRDTSGEEHDARRLRIVNRALKSVVDEFPNARVVDYASRVCTGKGGTEPIGDVRPDGAHLDKVSTVALWRWLQPQIAHAIDEAN